MTRTFWFGSPLGAAVRMFGTVIVTLMVLLSLGSPSNAAALCLPHTDLSQQLEARYAESPVAIGVANSGRLVQVYASGDGATWTIVATTPQGVSCILASGEAWDARKPVVLGPDA